MKTFILCAALILAAQAVGAQTEIQYRVRTVEILGLQDINLHGDLVASEYPIGGGIVFTKKQKLQGTPFNCGNDIFDDTAPNQINNQGDIIGTCLINGQHGREVGFIRDKNNAFTFIDDPSFDGVQFFGINDTRKVVGLCFTPSIPNQSGFFRFHGCTWDSKKKFAILDYPLQFSVTTLVGVNRHEKILGWFFSFDPATNETGQPQTFLYENGFFNMLNVPGAIATQAIDINNYDQVLLDSSEGEFFYDDGHFFKITLPTTMDGLPAFWQTNGMNDDGQLVGQYITRDCPPNTTDPFFCKMAAHGFIATPTKGKNSTQSNEYGENP